MLDCLKALYAEPSTSALLHDADYVEGVVFGVAAAPEIPMPDRWLVWALSERNSFVSEAQADSVGEGLLSVLRHQLALMRDSRIALPNRFECPQPPYSDVPVSRWFNGLLVAHQHLDQVWVQAWERMTQAQPSQAEVLAKDLGHCLKVFSTFADVPLALEQGKPGLEAHLPMIFKSLNQSLATYVKVAGALAAHLPNQFETFVKK